MLKLRWNKISRYYPPWLEFLPLILFAMVLYYINNHYELLPDLMPTHFGPSGKPDAWSEKSLWSVYAPLIIGFVVLCKYCTAGTIYNTASATPGDHLYSGADPLLKRRNMRNNPY